MIDKRIAFEERVDSEIYDTTTLYFIAPKIMLKRFLPVNKYPEAISMEICIEFPSGCIKPEYADVYISPTREVDGGTEEYDWHNVDLPLDEIEELITLVMKGVV